MYRESSHQESLSADFYQNPVLAGDWPDPAVLREGDRYYLVTSTARYYPGLTIWHSTDLVTWAPLCNPISGFEKDVWAPDILRWEDWYYIYFSASGSNYVTRSRRIDSGWCPPVDLCIDHIDPGHCSENGKRYLMLSGGYLAPLSEDGMRVTGALKKVMEPAPIPDEWDVEGPYPESPKITQKDGFYYLTYADGGTGGPATSHMVMSARAKSLFGPWEFSPFNPIVHTWSREELWHSKGHGHLVEDCGGNWWILYHAYRKDYTGLGRSLLLEPIQWTADGWFRLSSHGDCTLPIRKPAGRPLSDSWELSDHFDAQQLKLTWKMFGRERLSRVQTGGGMLKMDGEGDSPGVSAPLVLSSGDCSYVASVTVDRPDRCAAGLILIYDESHFTAASWDGSQVTLYRLGMPIVSVPAEGQKLRLYLRNDQNEAAFYCSIDGAPLRKLNYVIAVHSMNGTAYGGGNSLRPGLFAFGEGQAVFRDFRYDTRHALLLNENGRR